MSQHLKNNFTKQTVILRQEGPGPLTVDQGGGKGGVSPLIYKTLIHYIQGYRRKVDV